MYHAPMEEKDVEARDGHYEHTYRTYWRRRGHDINIVLANFNVRVGKVGLLSPIVEKFSLLDGLRLIYFAGGRKMVAGSTR